MRMTRGQTKERNRRALLEAAREVLARDGHRARLEEIADRAGLTTGAVYSLFGSKDGLVTALVAEHLRGDYEEAEREVGADLDLVGAVGAFARLYRRGCRGPRARSDLALQAALMDMALRDEALRSRLADSIAAQEERLAALFAGRDHGGAPVGADRARRLATALRALLVGMGQGVVLGLTRADERFFADAARALVCDAVLEGPGPGVSAGVRGPGG
ncbi:TetR/AcrR family transcriptional regulator [Nocardiopsis sp. NPDC057823]|uniref:TetR/AcrR family transcriptional regulator n=1 Tax=Nocardiopsis sp. NPDC057823 TaxID=3346256 RepID=UPI00366FCA22